MSKPLNMQKLVAGSVVWKVPATLGLGLMLMLLFAVKLHWLPAEGMHSVSDRGFLDLCTHMIMPGFVLGIGAAREHQTDNDEKDGSATEEMTLRS